MTSRSGRSTTPAGPCSKPARVLISRAEWKWNRSAEGGTLVVSHPLLQEEFPRVERRRVLVGRLHPPPHGVVEKNRSEHSHAVYRASHAVFLVLHVRIGARCIEQSLGRLSVVGALIVARSYAQGMLRGKTQFSKPSQQICRCSERFAGPHLGPKPRTWSVLSFQPIDQLDVRSHRK